MFATFNEVLEKAKKFGPVTISVAAGQDKDVLHAVKTAFDLGLIKIILVGDERLIQPMMVEAGLPADTPVVHEPDAKQAALTAASVVKSGKAQILMKGLVNSGDFLKAVVNNEVGLRTGRVLSHLTAYEIPGAKKLVFFSDGGINIAPKLNEKRDILANAISALNALGIHQPNVAILAANEVVNSKMPATVDAKELAIEYEGQNPLVAIVEGPIAMDVALNSDAAKHKGITSKIAGNVDLFMMPNIEAGNITSKALIHYANFKIAGVILGATHPIVMVSRADSAEAKLYSIALACLLVAGTLLGE